MAAFFQLLLALTVFATAAHAQLATSPQPFRISAYALGSPSQPAVAGLGDPVGSAGFVVTWTSNGQDGSGAGVYAKRFSATAVAAAPEFRVNGTVAGDQAASAVAGLAGGGFVVVWASNGQDGSGWGIYGQRYNASGARVGGEFAINTITADDQITPAVAAVEGGGFVVVWTTRSASLHDAGDIWARLYNSAGTAMGPDFPVNSTIVHRQQNPTVAGLSGGGFVVAWQSRIVARPAGFFDGIYARLFTAAGAPVAAEFPAYCLGSCRGVWHQRPRVAALDNGGFMLTWLGTKTRLLRGRAILGLTFDSNGAASGPQLKTMPFGAALNANYGLAALAGGGFVVVGDYDRGADGLVGRYYSASAQAHWFAPNRQEDGTILPTNNKDVAAASVGDNGFVVVWTSNVPSGVGSAVYGRSYRAVP